MKPDLLFLLTLIADGVGALLALGGLRWESLRQGSGLYVATTLGLLFQTAGIGVYCAQSPTHFFTAWSEIFWLLSWALSIVFLALLVGWKMRSLGALVLPLNVALLAAARFYTAPGLAPSDEAIGHPLFAVHVLSAFLGYGLFLLALIVFAGCADYHAGDCIQNSEDGYIYRVTAVRFSKYTVQGWLDKKWGIPTEASAEMFRGRYVKITCPFSTVVLRDTR